MNNLINKQPYQFGMNIPTTNTNYNQAHFHGPNSTSLVCGHIKFHDNSYRQTFNSYESAMLDLAATYGNWKRY